MPGKFIDPQVNIPPAIEQGDSPSWLDVPFTDSEGTLYSAAAGYALTYYLAGPGSAISQAGAAQGESWQTTLSTSQTNGLNPGGTWWWEAKLSGNGIVLTVARGELTVIATLANAGSNYSGLSQAEQNLKAWQSAAAALGGQGGSPVSSYKIGERELRYRDMREILDMISYWQTAVNDEQQQNSIAQGQGNPRKLYASFGRRRVWWPQ